MTSVKTVEYAFPVLASLSDNTLTALTQITVYLPEDSKVFKSVVATLTADDIITASGGTVAARRIDISVNGAGATTVLNTTNQANSTENLSTVHSGDFTSHFTSNWGVATSRTVDCSVLIDQSSGTTLGWVNVCVTLSITYEYDEASATHVKTVWVPLDAPVGALASSKPGSATDTIPNLSTYCPEASKTFRQINIVVRGNHALNGSTTDTTLSIEIDSAGAQTTGNHEAALASDRWFVRVFPAQSFSTSSSHSFYIWGSATKYNHVQVWMVVTYEFDPSSSTSMLNSVWLPAQAGLAIGHGTSSSAFIRAAAQLWIEEPGSIANGRIAFYGWWQAAGALSGANFRVGTGSFVAYTDTASVLCGGNGLMVRNDSAFTLARGRNTLTADAYASAGLGWGFGGLFLVCYTSDVPTDGVHVANKSVRLGSVPFGTPSITSEPKSEIGPFDLQASAYFINGAFALTMINQLATFSGFVAAYVADTANDDTRNTRPEDAAAFDSDTETGTVVTVFDLTQGVMRWPAQQRLRPIVDLESATAKVGYTRRSASTHFAWDFWLTYHQITFSVAGDVSDSDGGTVNLTLHRASDGEQLASTSRSGDGAYSMTWYDDTEDVYVSAYEDATHVGRSAPDTAA